MAKNKELRCELPGAPLELERGSSLSTWWLQISDRDVFGNIEKCWFPVILFIRVDLMQHGEILLSLMFVLFAFKAVCVVWPWCSDYITFYFHTKDDVFTDVGYRGLKHLVFTLTHSSAHSLQHSVQSNCKIK